MANENNSEQELSVHEGSRDLKGRSITPWLWVPTANFASGLPYVIVATLSTIVFKNMGVSNENIGYWTSLLLLPYTFKPLWSPLVDRYWAKRNWIVLAQAIIGICFFLVAAAIQFPKSMMGELMGGAAKAIGAENLPQFYFYSLIALMVVALASATYDIACDGFYMLALRDGQQSYFVGIRSTFYRLAMIGAGGLLPIVAGLIQDFTGPKYQEIVITSEPGIVESAPVQPDWAALAGSTKDQQILMSSKEIAIPPGKTADVMVRLAQPPLDGSEVVVLTRPVDGPKGLDFKSGDRIAFTTENWDQPSTLTLAVAEKEVIAPTTWHIRSSAGRIKLSWMVVFLSCGLIFLGMAVYHSAALPTPQADIQDTTDRPPFYKPLIWLGLAVGLPTVIWYVGSTELADLIKPFREKILEGVANPKMKTLFEQLFKLGQNTAILLVAFLVLRFVSPVRRVASEGFNFASRQSGINFSEVFSTFFAKHKIGVMLAFILLFRLGEAQIVKMGAAFLLDERSKGGLGLTATQVGIVYNTVGVVCLTIGGIIGGYLIATYGLKKVIWPLVAAMHIPNTLYVFMAITKPTSIWIISTCVGIEQLGYGIGFASFMMYLIFAAQGEYKTSHYALCTGFMSLGMMLPMMFSGFLQSALDYPIFFVLACLLVIPGVLVIPFLPMDDDFGKSSKNRAKA
ncbi:hypothetical protein GC173_10460 [bacterium]|nr:hypothetical protein [bacterium]